MIEPSKDDIGRSVIYQAAAQPPEEGIITSFNGSYVFVRYGADHHSKATSRCRLNWSQIRRS
jgi:hypothetical protein